MKQLEESYIRNRIYKTTGAPFHIYICDPVKWNELAQDQYEPLLPEQEAVARRIAGEGGMNCGQCLNFVPSHLARWGTCHASFPKWAEIELVDALTEALVKKHNLVYVSDDEVTVNYADGCGLFVTNDPIEEPT